MDNISPILIFLYLYLNLFLSWQIFHSKLVMKKKEILYLVVWILPFLGYLLSTFYVIIDDQSIDNKTREIFKTLSLIGVYFILYLIFS